MYNKFPDDFGFHEWINNVESDVIKKLIPMKSKYLSFRDVLNKMHLFRFIGYKD